MRRERTGGYIRILLMAVVSVFVIIGMTGCGMKRKFAIEKMLSYMKHKYGEDFVYVDSYAGQTGKAYIMILVSSSKHKERQALVRYSERDGRSCYEDNYLAYLLKNGLEERIGEFAGQCFGESKVNYKIPDFVFPSDFQTDMTADEFLKDSCSMPQFYIYPKDREGEHEKWEERAYDFQRSVAGAGYKIRGTVDLGNRGKLLFSMDEKGDFRYLRWV